MAWILSRSSDAWVLGLAQRLVGWPLTARRKRFIPSGSLLSALETLEVYQSPAVVMPYLSGMSFCYMGMKAVIELDHKRSGKGAGFIWNVQYGVWRTWEATCLPYWNLIASSIELNSLQNPWNVNSQLSKA